MRKRVLLAMVVGGTLSVLAPAAYATATTLPPACVVVHGPSGATVQVGYAPNGPGACRQL